MLKNFVTVVVQSILSPFSAHDAQENTAQVVGAKNGVASVLEHSLLKETPPSQTNAKLKRTAEGRTERQLL